MNPILSPRQSSQFSPESTASSAERSMSSPETSSSSEWDDDIPPLNHELDESVLNLHVECIRVSLVAEDYGIYEHAHDSTHAVIYLLTSDGKSVELNMGSPSVWTYMGKFVVRHRPFRDHRNSYKRWTVRVSNGLLFRQILHVIETETMHLYKYDPSGLGCRYWV